MKIFSPYRPSLSRFFFNFLSINLLCCLPLTATSYVDAADIEQLHTLLKLDFAELMEVEITVASKSAETVAEAPSSVTVFTRQEIQNMGVTTLGDLLDFVPGFQSFRLALNGDSQGFQVRGNPMLPAFTRDVLVLQDGRRLNGSHSGGAVLYNAYLSLDNVKQVEIIRGPGSALYGSNAFLGVINIITLDHHNAVSLRVGSNAMKEALLHFSQAVEKAKISGFLRVYGDQGDDYGALSDRFGHEGRAQDRRRSADAHLKLSLGQFDLLLRHTHRRTEDFLDSEYLGDNGINQSENEQSSLAFNYRLALSKALALKFSGGYTRSQLYFLSHTGTFQQTRPELFGLFLENDALNVDVDVDWTSSTDHHWQAGFTYENTGNTDNALIDADADGFLRYGRGEEGFSENRDRDIFGLYVQHQRRWQKNLEVVAGLRYDYYSDFGHTLNPRGALVYTTDWDDRIKLLYGQAFRAPNLADLTLRVNNSTGNPDLKPEKVETIELAYVHTAEYGQSILTLFRNQVTDVIAIQPDENGQFFAHNEGGLKRHGVELEMSLEPLQNWLLRGTYTRIFEGAERHAPGHFGSLMLNYQYKRWNVNLNGTYQGKILSLPEPKNTALANASVRYQLSPKISLQGTVYNLTNQDYYDPPEFSTQTEGRLRGMEPGIPHRGRWFWLGFEMRFD